MQVHHFRIQNPWFGIQEAATVTKRSIFPRSVLSGHNNFIAQLGTHIDARSYFFYCITPRPKYDQNMLFTNLVNIRHKRYNMHLYASRAWAEGSNIQNCSFI